MVGAERGRILQRFGAVRGGRLVRVRARSGKATDTLRARLLGNPAVSYAEPDFFLFASQARVPNDPLYTFEWPLLESSADHDIDAPLAWATRTGCAKVAVLDTGIDTDHPDLETNVFKSEDKPSNGKDDDRNGYVDDTYGYNAIKGKGSSEDDNGHGTHVAGIVGARGNNGLGEDGDLLVDQARRREVHELQGQGTHLGRHRGHPVRGHQRPEDHQLLVRLERLLERAARRRRPRAGPERPAGGGRRQQRPEHRKERELSRLLPRVRPPAAPRWRAWRSPRRACCPSAGWPGARRATTGSMLASTSPERPEIEVRIDPRGAIRQVSCARWGPLDGEDYGYISCGCDVQADRRFGDVTIPSKLTVSWRFGTPRQSPFFKAEITAAEPIA